LRASTSHQINAITNVSSKLLQFSFRTMVLYFSIDGEQRRRNSGEQLSTVCIILFFIISRKKYHPELHQHYIYAQIT
jgi:hypothetical protein